MKQGLFMINKYIHNKNKRNMYIRDVETNVLLVCLYFQLSDLSSSFRSFSIGLSPTQSDVISKNFPLILF